MTSSPDPNPDPSPSAMERGEEGDDALEDWVLMFEHRVVNRWGWSLREIDETDMESLIPFVFEAKRYQGETLRQAQGAGPHRLKRKVFCDQVGWL